MGRFAWYDAIWLFQNAVKHLCYVGLLIKCVFHFMRALSRDKGLETLQLLASSFAGSSDCFLYDFLHSCQSKNDGTGLEFLAFFNFYEYIFELELVQMFAHILARRLRQHLIVHLLQHKLDLLKISTLLGLVSSSIADVISA